MPAANFVIDGIEDLQNALGRVNENMQGKAARRALTKGGAHIVKDARRLVPSRFGLLKISLGQKVRSRRGLVVSAIGARRGFKSKKADQIRTRGKTAGGSSPSRYAHLVEFGTAPHIIKPNNAEALAILSSGKVVDEVNHPGSRPHPFLRPAFEMNRTAAFTVMSRTLGEFI